MLYEEITKFLGDKPAKLSLDPQKKHVIMLVGIQGSGKTTGAVKLARFYQKRGLKVAIICTDTYRPGAFEQLKQLADKANIITFGMKNEKKPDKIAQKGLTALRQEGFDIIIVDTAGRHKNERDDYVGPVLTEIFNIILNKEVFPKVWKIAVLPVLFKIFE